VSGSGPPIISAYAVVKAFLQRGRSVDDIEEQAELDDEELREVEYEEMGLPLPKRPVEQPTRRRILGLFGRR
jgi:hypothetical protein